MKLATILAVLASSIVPMAIAAPMVMEGDAGAISTTARRDGSTQLDPDFCAFKNKRRTIKNAGEGDGAEANMNACKTAY
ncbi:hypothetical protein QBC37DRAFT_434379 [Rhypophila decipiens]|uniref:Uncharacterized protein n=1 Tax=Rhypophila decipiens TaxID=261697 RepID=A0AAN6XTW2_9PEZI|nr:hypothetical protein QBC37DRAFT_434379 [Rhypophila decipiens]